MITIAYLILLCICIALSIIIYQIWKDTEYTLNRLKDDEKRVLDTIHQMNKTSFAISKNVVEQQKRIETISGENAYLNNKVSRISTGMDLLKKQIKDLEEKH